MIDNLMDLTHETYVHATSIGQHEIETAVTRTVDDHAVVTNRYPCPAYGPRRSGRWRCATAACRRPAGGPLAGLSLRPAVQPW